MKLTFNLSKEEFELALLQYIFATKGWRLLPKDVEITYIDSSDPKHGICVNEIEIDVVSK